MYNHAPLNYICPICLGIQGIENKNTLIRKNDIVYQDSLVTSLINSFFIGNNPGHLIIVPNQHFENIYDLPTEYAHHIVEIAKKMSLVVKKAYKAKGITILQNNEPAGNQHAFHYHLHVFPRYANDELHKNIPYKRLTTPQERLPYAEKIKEALSK